MLLKILYFIVVVLIIRVALRMFRQLFSSPRSHSRDAQARKVSHPTRGKRVIDVDYTEDSQDEERL